MTTTEPAPAVTKVLDTDAAPLAPLTQEHHQPPAGAPAVELPADPDAALLAAETALKGFQNYCNLEVLPAKRRQFAPNIRGELQPVQRPEVHERILQDIYAAVGERADAVLPLLAHAIAAADLDAQRVAGRGPLALVPQEARFGLDYLHGYVPAVLRGPVETWLPEFEDATLSAGADPAAALTWLGYARPWLKARQAARTAAAVQQTMRGGRGDPIPEAERRLAAVVDEAWARHAAPRVAAYAAPARKRAERAYAAQAGLLRALAVALDERERDLQRIRRRLHGGGWAAQAPTPTAEAPTAEARP